MPSSFHSSTTACVEIAFYQKRRHSRLLLGKVDDGGGKGTVGWVGTYN